MKYKPPVQAESDVILKKVRELTLTLKRLNKLLCKRTCVRDKNISIESISVN